MRLALSNCELVAATWGVGKPSIVMLHDGLGSIEQWRDVPELVAQRTGATVLAYDREGHGSSTPIPTDAWPPDWMSQQATVLGELLDKLGIVDPILVGHSDGGSIALLHAASAGPSVSGVLALAPHSYVEQRCVGPIAAWRKDPQKIVAGLTRYHDDAARMFNAWSGGWTSPEFQTWDIRDQLGNVTAPTLVVQGVDDDYASDAMVRDTAAAVGETAEWQLLDGVGHLIHHDDPDLVVDVITTFVSAISRKE